ncbi:MAG: hypothetical protein KME45_15365 [Stenomitos rutilans HA7619-LM2]|jgi:hypothetical protein|nr:hypothetical protein [Stenomitos rutilans HA7619-LM2]
MQEAIQYPAAHQAEYLYPLLHRIKARPGMYLGRPSLTRLRMLLLGYSLARRELNLPLTEQEKSFDGFQDWIQQRFQIQSSQAWDSIILFHSTDEQEALTRFFQLFEEFCEAVKRP